MTKTIYIFTLSFFSFCSIGQTTVYSEDFQNGLPTDFTVIDNDGLTPAPAVSNYTAAWIELVDPTNTSDTIVGSTSFFSPVGQADRWLITPKIGLSDYGNILYWDAKSQIPPILIVIWYLHQKQIMHLQASQIPYSMSMMNCLNGITGK